MISYILMIHWYLQNDNLDVSKLFRCLSALPDRSAFENKMYLDVCQVILSNTNKDEENIN